MDASPMDTAGGRSFPGRIGQRAGHASRRLLRLWPELGVTAALALVVPLQASGFLGAVYPQLAAAGEDGPGMVRDLSLYVEAGRALWSGDVAGVYFDQEIQVGPLVLLGDSAVVHLFGSSAVAWGVVRFLVIWSYLLAAALLCRPAGSAPRQRTAALGVSAGLVVIGYAGDFYIWARWWYLPVMLLVLGAALLSHGGRTKQAGALVGLAVWMEPSAALGIVVLVLAPRVRAAWAGLVIAAVVGAAAYLPFVLSGGFAMGQGRWWVKSGSWAGVIFGEDSSFTMTWSGRMVQAAVAVALAVAVIVSMRRALPMPALAILATAVVPMSRLVTETFWWRYHWIVPFVFLVAGALRLAWLRRAEAVPVGLAAGMGLALAPLSAPLASGVGLALLASAPARLWRRGPGRMRETDFVSTGDGGYP